MADEAARFLVREDALTGVPLMRRLAYMLFVCRIGRHSSLSLVVAMMTTSRRLELQLTTADSDAGQAQTATESTATTTATTAVIEATPTDVIPTATASSTPVGGAEEIPLSLLVIPEPHDASIPQDGRVLGNPDAAVSIVEYGDFQ